MKVIQQQKREFCQLEAKTLDREESREEKSVVV